MLSDLEIRAIAQTVVNRTRMTAREDQGTLKKSIAFTLIRGLVTFRELYYGQYKGNARLEENAKALMPYGVSWRIIYTVLGGDEYETTSTRQGRVSRKKSFAAVNRSTTSNVNALIARIKAKEKKDGEKKEEGAVKG